MCVFTCNKKICGQFLYEECAIACDVIDGVCRYSTRAQNTAILLVLYSVKKVLHELMHARWLRTYRDQTELRGKTES